MGGGSIKKSFIEKKKFDFFIFSCEVSTNS